MGGTQRIAERAVAGRAREFFMSGDLDLQGAVESFLAEGPGRARFHGR
jgi:hypothetical protein